MSEREFGAWSKYASQKGMPWKRIEIQLARIAMLLDLGLGGAQRARLADYMGESLQELIVGKADTLADDIEDAFGGGLVIKRGG